MLESLGRVLPTSACLPALGCRNHSHPAGAPAGHASPLGAAGWAPNPPILHESTAGGMCSTFWRLLPAPAHGPLAGTTYDSQSTHIFTYTFQDGAEVLVWMGDRWNEQGRGSVGGASYVSVPWLRCCAWGCTAAGDDACMDEGESHQQAASRHLRQPCIISSPSRAAGPLCRCRCGCRCCRGSERPALSWCMRKTGACGEEGAPALLFCRGLLSLLCAMRHARSAVNGCLPLPNPSCTLPAVLVQAVQGRCVGRGGPGGTVCC